MTLYGFKTVRDDPGLDVWRDTSTLYITLLRGHVPPGEDGEVIGAGVLRILPADFAKQLITFRAAGQAPVRAVAQFGTHLRPGHSATSTSLRRHLGEATMSSDTTGRPPAQTRRTSSAPTTDCRSP